MNRAANRQAPDPASRRNPGAPPRPQPPGTVRKSGAPSDDEHGRSIFPPLSDILDPRSPFLIPIAILLVARAAFWVLVPLAAEDAYITFRFARNLATGHGLTYNPGEHVMGFSSPLWVVWEALGFVLTRDPLLWARVWSIGADVITVLVLGWMMKRWISNAAAWCFTFFFASWPYFSAVSMSGMEMNFMLAVLALSAALVEAGSPASGPALAMLAFSRPEGIPAAFVLSLGARWRDRAIAAGLLAIGLVGIYAAFGSIIPQSVIAKSQVYGTPGPMEGRHWYAWMSPIQLGKWPQHGETSHLLILNILLGPAFVMGAIEIWKRRSWAMARTLGAPLSIWIGYSLLGVAYFWWYLLLPLVAIVGLASIGLPQLMRGRALAIGCALTVIGFWSIAPNLYVARATEESLSFGRTADFLVRSARPGEKIMLEPIGLIGYRAPVVVVDEVGLVSPKVAARRLKGAGWYADIVADENPDWLVMRAGMMNTGAIFAGAGSPFRSQAERESLLARYVLADSGVEEFNTGALVVRHRER